MTSFSYTTGVPNPPNSPSNEVPLMQTNANSISSIIGVDHVGFNTTGSGGAGSSGGQHLQATFNSKNPPGSPPTDPISIAFTNSGVAATNPQLYFQNSQATYQISSLRAFGVFTTTLAFGAVTFNNGYNIASIVSSSGGFGKTLYTITLTGNVVSGNNVIVSAQTSNDDAVTYSFVAGVLSITAPGSGAKLSFIVYQA